MASGRYPVPARRQAASAPRKRPRPVAAKSVRHGMPVKRKPTKTKAHAQARQKRTILAFVLGIVAGIVTLYLAFFADGIRFEDRWDALEKEHEDQSRAIDFSRINPDPQPIMPVVEPESGAEATSASETDTPMPRVQPVAHPVSLEDFLSQIYAMKETDLGLAMVPLPLSPPQAPVEALKIMRSQSFASQHGAWTALSEAVSIQDVTRDGVTLFVDVSSEIGTLSRADYRAATAQLGKTLLQIDGITSIRLTINGESKPTLGIHGFPNDPITAETVRQNLRMLQSS